MIKNKKYENKTFEIKKSKHGKDIRIGNYYKKVQKLNNFAQKINLNDHKDLFVFFKNNNFSYPDIRKILLNNNINLSNDDIRYFINIHLIEKTED